MWFPSAARRATAAIALGMPQSRVAALRGIAAAAIADPRLFACDGDLDAKIARLRALP